MKAARHLFEEIRPQLNLPNLTVAAENFKPLEVKHYLMKNHLKFCILVGDATTVKDAFGNQERKQEYEDLLKTAAHEVGKFEFFYLHMKEKGFSPLYSTRWARKR